MEASAGEFRAEPGHDARNGVISLVDARTDARTDAHVDARTDALVASSPLANVTATLAKYRKGTRG